MKKLIWATIITFSLNSCATHFGTMNSNASLGAGNFEMLELVSSKAHTTKYFGFGGLEKSALVFEAKKDLYAEHPLNYGQAFANISVDFEERFILFINKTTVTLSADIVQFETSMVGKQSLFQNKANPLGQPEPIELVEAGNESFKIEENVYFKVGSIINSGVVRVILKNIVLVQSNGEDFKVNPDNLFHIFDGAEVTETFIGEISNRVSFLADNNENLEGKIIGLNSTSYLIELKEKRYVRKKSEVTIL